MEGRIVVVVPAYNEEKTISKTLDALVGQSSLPDGIVVVNNNSNDKTGDIVGKYQNMFPGVHLVSELKKGTGAACNTGFRYAMEELKADIVSRTDADTIPANNWNEEIAKYFREHPTKQLVSGPSRALKDEFYRNRDKILWPVMHTAFRIGNVAVTRSLWPDRFAIGHNMAVVADAFKDVGGFPESSIDEADEDVELSKRIYNRFGLGAMGYDHSLLVRTSMRRIRQLQRGYLGLPSYYWNPATPPSQERRMKMTGGDIDKR